MASEEGATPAPSSADLEDDLSGECQLMTLRTAGTEAVLTTRITPLYVLRSAAKAARHPLLAARKAVRVGQTIRRNREGVTQATRPDGSGMRIPPLGLQPGEWVRVKTALEIRATLDDEGRYDRLGYMDNVMDRFCGSTLRVRSRVERFFDERNWKMMRLRDVVLLDGAYCRPGPDDPVSWAGCQRSCFLFWKEAWLQRVPAPTSGSPDPHRSRL